MFPVQTNEPPSLGETTGRTAAALSLGRRLLWHTVTWCRYAPRLTALRNKYMSPGEEAGNGRPGEAATDGRGPGGAGRPGHAWRVAAAVSRSNHQHHVTGASCRLLTQAEPQAKTPAQGTEGRYGPLRTSTAARPQTEHSPGKTGAVLPRSGTWRGRRQGGQGVRRWWRWPGRPGARRPEGPVSQIPRAVSGSSSSLPARASPSRSLSSDSERGPRSERGPLPRQPSSFAGRLGQPPRGPLSLHMYSRKNVFLQHSLHTAELQALAQNEG
ncbi:hypothetical protein AAFF_G00379330 [Aldrovandia affinis]|uniref:Uncharacterized protein n=1 Tax=Aldrovandia affinis TaxID=143900 RepID=A0AAD7SHM1_9TELE|nr:hypothetical protein AAFF_G00379330 [Aldrovandia affinis]